MNSTDNTKEPELDVAPETNSSRLSNKIVLVTTGFILLVVGIIGGWYMGTRTQTAQTNQPSPSPIPSPEASDEMEGWKTYSGNNFSFKYPNNWYIDTEGETEDYVRLQNFDPSTAPARGYDPVHDKGLFAVSFWGEDSKLKTVDELKQELNKEKQCLYVGDPAGESISLNEQTKTFGSIMIYSRDTRCSQAPVSTLGKEYFILNGKDKIVKAFPGLDVESGIEYLDQILSTFRFVDVASKNGSSKQTSPTIPSDWKTYDKRFADAKYFFRYPPAYEVYDLDPDSGSIYLSKVGTNNYPVYLTINTISNSGWLFDPYTSGSRRVWYKNNLEKQNPDENFSSLTFKEVDYADGKSYLFVSNFPEYLGNSRYIGIQNGIPIVIGHPGLMSSDEVMKILSTVSVTK